MDLKKLIAGKKLTDSELKVLDYIVENIDNAMNMGVRTIAKNNYTSTSTIMRLTKKLGYTGFVDMCYKLSPLIQSPSFEHQEFDEQSYFSSASLFELNDYATVKKVAAKIYEQDEKFAFIYATGFSGILGEYLYKKLLVLGKKSMISSGNDSVGIFENNLTDIELMFAISKSGETAQVVDKAKTAKENGIYLISFTKETTNSLATISDINFKIEDYGKLDDLNTMPNSFFPNLIMLFEMIVFEYHQLIIN